MDSEEVKYVNVTVNETLGFLNNTTIQNILRVLIFMYISKTAVNNPFIEKLLSQPAGKIGFLTLALWLGNKNFVHSLVVAASIVLILGLLSAK